MTLEQFIRSETWLHDSVLDAKIWINESGQALFEISGYSLHEKMVFVVSENELHCLNE